MRKVDIELPDMADQLGVTLRRLMAGLQTGRFSEHVTEDDIVYGDKGDPLFFRIEQNRALGICGADLPDVEKDMSTIEKMSTTTEEADEEVSEEVSESVQTLVRESSPPATTSKGDPPVSTSESRQNETEVQEGESASGGLGEALLYGGAVVGGAWLLGALFGDQSSLSGRQVEEIYYQGAKARLEGRHVNPYANDEEAREAFLRGWWDADAKKREQIAAQTTDGVSVGLNMN